MVRSFDELKILLLFCLVNAYLQVSSSYHLSERLNITRYKRQTTDECSKQQFECAPGLCIPKDQLCDGKVDCYDASDETLHCGLYEIECFDDEIKCHNGDCVKKSKGCLKPPLKDGCILPPQPTNGNYSLPGPNITLVPGHPISANSHLNYECDEGYALYPVDSRFLICFAGQWDKEIPQCVKVCPPRVSESVMTKCELDNNKVDCSKPMLEGTLVSMKCNNLHEAVQPSRNPKIRCRDGSWDSDLIKCIPVCGKMIRKGQKFVIGGETTQKGDFPWHVGVYQNKENTLMQICGGSLINQKMVLSAAHCFTEDYGGKKFPEKDFLIAAGKYYRNFNDSRDTYAQNSSVIQFLVHDEYRGQLTNYAADIAIVILETAFTITYVVQPICVDWTNELEDSQLITGQQGAVVGWGYTKEGSDPSDDLKKLRVPFIERGRCFEVVPEDFYGFLTLDKICAGFTNGSSVCQGDSGGGLVFYSADTKRYYIRGLVSVGPIKGDSCDSRQYGAYTKVSQYLEFISRAEVIYRPD